VLINCKKHPQIMYEMLFEVSNEKQISTGWNFEIVYLRLCITYKFNRDIIKPSKKRDNRV
jgi:hypothetical protein